jgi:hypothetical protein
LLVEVLGVVLQSATRSGSLFLTIGLIMLVARFRRMLGRALLGDAVRNEIDHIQPRNTLLMQVVDSMGVFFAENGHQNVGAGHFFLAKTGRAGWRAE